MKIHEFQAKEILRAPAWRFPGVSWPIRLRRRRPPSHLWAGSLAVVKAQIHAGGRGKGTLLSNPKQHGVQLVKTAAEAGQVAGALLGQTLVTIQTGPAGQTVRQVLIEEGCQIARELYLGIVVDRQASRPVVMVSSQGGMDIEHVAAETPELIFREPLDVDAGLHSYQVRKICSLARLTGQHGPLGRNVSCKALCRVFVASDCSLVEINPLVVTAAGDLIALDAKITLDDNALFRHKDLAELRDLSEEEPAEIRRRQSRFVLRQARRQYRLPGQRCRTGHEHDGLDQVPWRRTCQLS